MKGKWTGRWGEGVCGPVSDGDGVCMCVCVRVRVRVRVCDGGGQSLIGWCLCVHLRVCVWWGWAGLG